MNGTLTKANWMIAVLLVLGSCNFFLTLAQRLGVGKQAPLDLPPGVHDVHNLGNGWHTFRLTIGGKDRLFLRRLYPNYENTESLSEIVDPVETVSGTQAKH